MLKPGNNYLTPRSPGNSNKKNGNSRPKSKKGNITAAKGSSGVKSQSSKEKESNLFEIILDDERKETAASSKNNVEDKVAIEKVAMDGGMKGGTKRVLRDKFGHKMYQNASNIYAYLKGEINASAIPSFSDEYQKRRSYSIAFAAKRYEEVLKDVLLDSHFYSMYSRLEAQHHNKVMVMLMDYYDHNFRFSDSKRVVISEDTQEPQELIRDIQEAIVSHQVHLCASFARCRIRDCALCLEDLVNDGNKEALEYAKQQPLYGRINTLKTTTDDVMNLLINEGFVLAEDTELGELTGRMFRKDPHFDDMLVFSKECKDDVYSLNITMDLWLYPQDKGKYVIVEVMKSLLVEMAVQKDKAMHLIPGEMKSFLTDGDDVLLTNPDSGSLSAHLAAFINPERKLYICGCGSDSKSNLESKILASGVKNFELVEESFTEVSHHDERLKRVRIVMCNVPCSKSAVVNPVDFVLQEGNVAAKLLSGKVDTGKQKAIISEELMIIKHALKFSQAQSILYFTSSENSSENEDLIMKALKDHREDTSLKNPFQLSPFLPDLVSNLRVHVQHSEDGMQEIFIGSDEKYLKLKPSSRMNGCFVALLKRQYAEASPKDIIDRSAKKGLTSKNKISKKSQRHVKSEVMKSEEIDTDQQEITRKDSQTDKRLFHKFF